MQVIVLLPILVVMPFEISQTDFMLWGTVYVVAKWTVGFWAFRRVKVYVAQRRIPAAADVIERRSGRRSAIVPGVRGAERPHSSPLWTDSPHHESHARG